MPAPLNRSSSRSSFDEDDGGALIAAAAPDASGVGMAGTAAAADPARASSPGRSGSGAPDAAGRVAAQSTAAGSEPLLFSEPGETRRFAPRSRGFIRRTRLVNGLLGGWPIVVGTGSWVEAHLVARLALAARLPNLCGCGVTGAEVLDLVQEAAAEHQRLPLLLLGDSLGSDQGRQLMRQLRRRHRDLKILLLVQDVSWLTVETLAACRAQAIVDVQSFGTGTLIRALQALRRGQSYVDPSLRQRLEQSATVLLSGRERQVLEGLARGLTNKQLALETEIAATTVRDYVSSLCRKLGAANRTQVVSRAIELGMLRGSGRG